MFTDSIIKYEIEKNKKIDKDGYERTIVYKNLNKFDRYCLSRIQTLISNLTTQIERDSGWEYFMGEFRCLSDYKLENGDITFKENKVPLKYNIDELNDKELIFSTKYSTLLNRILKLENKRKEYYNKALSKETNILYMEDYKPKRKALQNEIFIREWTEQEASNYIKEYNISGIHRLLDNLNSISEDRSIDDIYSDFMKQNITYTYKHDLLKWASTYSKKANQLLERFISKRNNIIIPKHDFLNDSFIRDESDIILYYKSK